MIIAFSIGNLTIIPSYFQFSIKFNFNLILLIEQLANIFDTVFDNCKNTLEVVIPKFGLYEISLLIVLLVITIRKEVRNDFKY